MMLDAIRSALAPNQARRVLVVALAGVTLECAACATTGERHHAVTMARPEEPSTEPISSTLAVNADVEDVAAQRNEPAKKPAPRIEPKKSPFPPTLGPNPLVVDTDDE